MRVVEPESLSNANYCQKCWSEFTMMTPEEQSNYQKIVAWLKEIPPQEIHNKRKRHGRSVICNETQVVYNSMSDCAEAIGVSITTLANHIKGKTKKKLNYRTYRYFD